MQVVVVVFGDCAAVCRLALQFGDAPLRGALGRPAGGGCGGRRAAPEVQLGIATTVVMGRARRDRRRRRDARLELGAAGVLLARDVLRRTGHVGWLHAAGGGGVEAVAGAEAEEVRQELVVDGR